MRGYRHLAVACSLVLILIAPAPRLLGAEVATTSARAQARAEQADWAHARRLDIILSEFQFAPSEIAVDVGAPYVLRLENKGWFRHDFTAPAFFRSVAFGPGQSASEAQRSGGSFSLAPGEVQEIEFVPLQAGKYALECTKPLHGLFGMSGDIIVR